MSRMGKQFVWRDLACVRQDGRSSGPEPVLQSALLESIDKTGAEEVVKMVTCTAKRLLGPFGFVRISETAH